MGAAKITTDRSCSSNTTPQGASKTAIRTLSSSIKHRSVALRVSYDNNGNRKSSAANPEPPTLIGLMTHLIELRYSKAAKKRRIYATRIYASGCGVPNPTNIFHAIKISTQAFGLYFLPTARARNRESASVREGRPNQPASLAARAVERAALRATGKCVKYCCGCCSYCGCCCCCCC